MESFWEKTTTDIEVIDWKGNPLCLKSVLAIKNKKTGQIRVDAIEVAKAEFRIIAETFGLEPRDVALLLLLYDFAGFGCLCASFCEKL